jgi:hypothetical protein
MKLCLPCFPNDTYWCTYWNIYPGLNMNSRIRLAKQNALRLDAVRRANVNKAPPPSNTEHCCTPFYEYTLGNYKLKLHFGVQTPKIRVTQIYILPLNAARRANVTWHLHRQIRIVLYAILKISHKQLH